MSRGRILLLHNQPILPKDHPEALAELDVLETVDVVADILARNGFELTRFGLGEDLHPLHHVLGKECPDAVFNLFEGLADRPFTESVVAGVLEWSGVPFTGCPSECLTLCRDKMRSKLMFRGAGLPTAPFEFVDEMRDVDLPFELPAIVKPAGQDASVGIEQSSVVTDRAELDRQLERVVGRFGSALVEQYIDGREIMVSMIDTMPGRDVTILPLAELVFSNPDVWPIYTYEAKWLENSIEFQSVPIQVPVEVPDSWRERIESVALAAYRLLGCRDYARLDMRVSPSGEPYLLEMNPNPFLNSLLLTEGFKAIGHGYDQFILDLIEAALERRPGARSGEVVAIN